VTRLMKLLSSESTEAGGSSGDDDDLLFHCQDLPTPGSQ
jgi:hypothetical protein